MPGAASAQAFNRYMYVNGNPVRSNDPSGHFSMGGVVSAIAGSIVGGVTGAAAGYAAYSAYKNKDKIESAMKNAGRHIKSFVSDHRPYFTAALGAFTGGWMLAPLGAIYGYALGSDGGIKEFWKDHQWFRITTYVLVTVAVICFTIACPPAGAAAFSLSNTALVGAIAGAFIGGTWSGTNGYRNEWNWENAARGMMKGAIIGASIGYAFSSAKSAYLQNSDTLWGANNPIESGFAPENPLTYSEGAFASVGNAVGGMSPELYTVGAWALQLYLVYSIYATPHMLERGLNHGEIAVFGYGYDIDDHEAMR